jgi:hypothetical protein
MVSVVTITLSPSLSRMRERGTTTSLGDAVI